jgi:hypothetical protein
MNKYTLTVGLAFIIFGVTFSLAARAQDGAEDGPRYTSGTSLIRPDNYREWTFLSSGLSMAYATEGGAPSGPELFQNVFVNPSSYRHFMETGAWPDQTIFILELRRAATEGSINQAGRFQTDLFLLEAEVKDSRFPDGWAFFQFGRAEALRDVAEPLAGETVRECIECHTEHTAVERTFVQFYPTLHEVARRMGTLKPGF